MSLTLEVLVGKLYAIAEIRIRETRCESQDINNVIQNNIISIKF